MIEFKKLMIQDIEIIKPYIYNQSNRICDYTIGGIMMWRDYFNTEYCVMDHTLLLKVNYLNGEIAFSYPVGKYHKEMLLKLQEYCEQLAIPLIFCTITDDNLTYLKEIFPKLDIYANRDWFDYLYDADALKHYPGKKYNKVRNHLNRFHKLYKDWSFKRVQTTDLQDIIVFYSNYRMQHSKKSDLAEEEAKKVEEVLQNFEVFNLLGGILRVNGSIVAFSLGEVIHDTLYVHVEKADSSYAGIYQKIVSCFVNEFADENILYINREEDIGDEGLRKSKMAYRPISLLSKYTVRVL